MSLHWYRTESDRSPKGFELRAKHRNRTWRAWEMNGGRWHVQASDRPSQKKDCDDWRECREYAERHAESNPKTNPARRKKKRKKNTSSIGERRTNILVFGGLGLAAGLAYRALQPQTERTVWPIVVGMVSGGVVADVLNRATYLHLK